MVLAHFLKIPWTTDRIGRSIPAYSMESSTLLKQVRDAFARPLVRIGLVAFSEEAQCIQANIALVAAKPLVIGRDRDA